MSKILNLYYAISSKCNLRCSYCYVPEAAKSSKDEDGEAEANLNLFLRKIESEGFRIGAFCFHGAEPTIYDAKTLSRFCNLVLQAKKNTNSSNNLIAIQTNGYNLNGKYLKDLHENINPISALRIGFSVDFPKQIHDLYRNNTYDKVLNNFRTALDMGIDVSVLSVVTSEALSLREDWIEAVRGIYQLSLEYPNFRKFKLKPATGEFGLKEENMEEFADILIENEWTKLLQIFNYSYCLNKGNDCDWYEFSPGGECFSCNKAFMNKDSFSDWKLQSFDTIREKRANLYLREAVHPDCGRCQYEMYCNSGCPIDRYKAGQMAGKAHECTIVKKVYTHLQENGINIIDYIHQT